MKADVKLVSSPCPLGRVLRRALIAGFISASLAASGAPAAESPLNKRAPEFAINDLDGRTVDLAALRGKVVLLNFWATWCAPCQLELPIFAAWQRQYGPQGFAVIAVSMDDDAAPARRLVQRLKLNYPAALGDERLAKQYGGVLGLPLTFLIDRDGVVRAQFQGETRMRKIEIGVKALLAERRAQ